MIYEHRTIFGDNPEPPENNDEEYWEQYLHDRLKQKMLDYIEEHIKHWDSVGQTIISKDQMAEFLMLFMDNWGFEIDAWK